MFSILRSDIKESFLLALDAFRANKMRSFLTILGVLIGVASIIGMVTLIEGLNASMSDQIESLGSNLIYVAKFKPGIVVGGRSEEERKRKGITYEDAMAIREQCSAVEAVAPQNFAPERVKISYRDREANRPSLFGTIPEYETVNSTYMAEGRFIRDTDCHFKSQVCVLGADVAEALFPDIDPIGKEIMIGKRRFTVIGVAERREELLGDNFANNYVLLPYDTFMRIYPDEEELWLVVKARSPELIPTAIDQITELMRRRRGVPYDKPDDFAVFTQESLMEIYRQITAAVYVVMLIISSIGLLVGGVGVMNIMLVSVTERTREIGIRKALGAKNRQILWQFLIEAMTLSGFGGVLGIVLGLVIGKGVDWLTPLPGAVSPLWIALAFGFSVGVALVFGIYPAYRAARMDPIAALRYE